MEYCLVENGLIVNIIVADESIAEFLGALPSYDGARMGGEYNPPPAPEPDPDYITHEQAIEMLFGGGVTV